MIQGMESLKDLATEFHIELQKEQIQQFQIYYEYLIEKNKVMNLTTITEKEDVIFKHFLDSLSLCKIVEFGERLCSSEYSEEQKKKLYFNQNCRILDLGTGAGFPGLPLKIAFKETNVVLADSLQKRVLFLEELIKMLGLTGVTAIHGRAEELAIPHPNFSGRLPKPPVSIGIQAGRRLTG